jgi:hypothetical protein
VVWNWAGPGLVDRVSAADQRRSLGAVRLRIASLAAGTQQVRLCIEPSGRTLLRDADGTPFADNLLGQTDIVFTVVQQNGGVDLGARRNVVFPNSSIPRWVQ